MALDALLDGLRKGGSAEAVPCLRDRGFSLFQQPELPRELESLGVDHEYQEEPGTHEWGFWDRWIKYVVENLPIPNEEG